MQVEVIESAKEVFKPIVIKLTIGSEYELADLTTRLNCPSSHANQVGQYGNGASAVSRELWRILENFCQDRNIPYTRKNL